MKPLDDNELAKTDIVSRPDVTAKTAVMPEQKPAPEMAQDDTSERNGRLVAKRLARFWEKFTGEPCGDDEREELADIGTMMFKALPASPLGRGIGVTICAACMALPFVPKILKLFKPKEEINNG